MSTEAPSDLISAAALEPLYPTWQEPDSHRIKADKSGDPAKVVQGRRPSPIIIAQNLRGLVRDWRDAFHAGASDTSRTLLNHWFERSVRRPSGEGTDRCGPFRGESEDLDRHTRNDQPGVAATNAASDTPHKEAVHPPVPCQLGALLREEIRALAQL